MFPVTRHGDRTYEVVLVAHHPALATQFAPFGEKEFDCSPPPTIESRGVVEVAARGALLM